MAFFLVGGLIVFALLLVRSVIAQDWRTASHEPMGLAPNPATTNEAVVQVYGARTWGWRGRICLWAGLRQRGRRSRRRWSLTRETARQHN